MGVSGLALAAALAGVQPTCNSVAECPPPSAQETLETVADAVATPVEAPVGVPADGPADAAADGPVPLDEGLPPAPQADAAPADALPREQAAQQAPEGAPIIVTGGTPQGDPAQQLNAATFETVQKIDDAVVAPLAKAYDKDVPKPIRKGLRNFLYNLGEPISFINFMLQLKPGRAFKALGRFTINSTIGLAGLFDVAKKKPFNLPRDFNGFANTLAFYGVGPGPYLYLPFIGSTTVRDLFGRVVDLSVVPTLAGKPFNQPIYAIPAGALNSLESRIIIDEQIKAVRDECGDAYSATRDIYLIGRQIEIDALRGRESKELGELVERLKVNCDISVIRAATEEARLADLLEGVEAADVAPPPAVEPDSPAADPVASEPAVETVDPSATTPANEAEPDEAGPDEAQPLAA